MVHDCLGEGDTCWTKSGLNNYPSFGLYLIWDIEACSLF